MLGSDVSVLHLRQSTSAPGLEPHSTFATGGRLSGLGLKMDDIRPNRR